MAKDWITRIARLIDSNRYEDAVRDAQAGTEEIGQEIKGLEEQLRDLAQLRDAAAMISRHISPKERAPNETGPKLTGNEIGLAADSLLSNGRLKVTAEEIRDELNRRGIDTSVVRHPTSVISTVLTRDKRFVRVGTGEFRRAEAALLSSPPLVIG